MSNIYNIYQFALGFDKEINSFLNLLVKRSNNKFATDLFIRVADRHQYLHYTSSHPERSIVCSQKLRLSHICFAEKDFVKHSCEMKLRFLNRGYSQKPVENQMKKVKFSI